MPTNKQRREAARRHLERQLERRQEQEARRKRLTLILSVVGTLVLIGVVVVAVVVFAGKDPAPANAAGGTSTSPAAPAPSVSYPPATGAAVSLQGVTVKGATDLKGYPVVTSKSAKDATALAVKDLVVGKGKAATPVSTVTIQYTGVLYKDGTEFDSSWTNGRPAQFALTQVVKGFTQGIGGTTGVAAMKEGGRRIMILPASLGYGAQAQGKIPANASLVFVVDLVTVDG